MRYIDKNISWVTASFFALLPATLFISTFYKIRPLKSDRTAENLAYDVLNSLPDNSVIFLMDDTTLFDTEYLYYTTGGKQAWRGIKFIDLGAVGYSYYDEVVKRQYPEIKSLAEGDPADRLKRFISENIDNYPIYSNVNINIGEEFAWVPYGLLKKVQAGPAVLDSQSYVEQNNSLMGTYHDPTQGALKIYLHVMLADVLRVYANAYHEIGDTLLKNQQPGLAEPFFRTAVRVNTETVVHKLKLAESLMRQKNCAEAEEIQLNILKTYPSLPEVYQGLVSLYRDCLGNFSEAEKYERLFEEKAKNADLQLDSI